MAKCAPITLHESIFAKEVMIFYKELSSTVYRLHVFLITTWHHFLIIQMTSHHYHQTNLPANQLQLTYPQSPVNKITRLCPFLTWLISNYLKKIVLVEHIYFFFNQIFSNLILGLLFCHVNHLCVQHLVHHMHVHLLTLLLLYVTKNHLLLFYT